MPTQAHTMPRRWLRYSLFIEVSQRSQRYTAAQHCGLRRKGAVDLQPD